MILETHGLSKNYGRITALKNLTVQVDKGMVFGLLGPNGSGKTTTLGILLNVLTASAGTYSWFGAKPSSDSRKKIGAILEHPCFFPYLSAYQNLRIVCQIKECSYETIDRVLEIVDLKERKNDPFKTYSLGMKQRLAIASALLSDPLVLILDEPTNGLDPQGIVEIRNLIRMIAESGKTIVLASHLLDEVQKICSHFMVLKKGEKLYQGSVAEALSDQRSIELASENMDELKTGIAQLPGLIKLKDNQGKILLQVEKSIKTIDINRYLISKNIVVSHLQEKSGDLESQFLKILSEHD